jgi:hypothetical protein
MIALPAAVGLVEHAWFPPRRSAEAVWLLLDGCFEVQEPSRLRRNFNRPPRSCDDCATFIGRERDSRPMK